MLTPRRMKNVASVTMKLGSFDFTTTNPFSRPISAAKTSVPTMASQAFQCARPTSRAMTIAVAPVMTPRPPPCGRRRRSLLRP